MLPLLGAVELLGDPAGMRRGDRRVADDRPFPSSDRLQRIYPFVQSKLYRIQLDFSAPTDTQPA
jgi:hypothetical protein